MLTYRVRTGCALLKRACLLYVALLCSLAQGQERELARHSPRDHVQQTWPHVDLIAVGEFGVPVELGTDQVSLLASRELDLSFEIRGVFKGSVKPEDTVLVRLRSDMLVFPGESISRYEKRRLVYAAKAEELRLAVADAAERVSDLQGRERDELARQLQGVNDRIARELAELGRIQRSVFASEPTFYRKGGVIKPDSSYLLAVASIDGNDRYYVLEERGGGIFWGEFADDIRDEIEAAMSRGSLPAPGANR